MVSQQWHYCHLGPDNYLLLGCPKHCRIFRQDPWPLPTTCQQHLTFIVTTKNVQILPNVTCGAKSPLAPLITTINKISVLASPYFIQTVLSQCSVNTTMSIVSQRCSTVESSFKNSELLEHLSGSAVEHLSSARTSGIESPIGLPARSLLLPLPVSLMNE
ncbi:hypothetical protein VULLAG_LOCUS4468 [Vulpes lagopus]